MIEFSNLVQVTPAGQGNSNPGKVFQFVADSFSFLPQLPDNEAGNHWNCDKTIVIDMPDTETRHFFSIERDVIVTIKSSDRRLHQIGTPDIPARVLISSNLNTCNLIIKCKMLTDPLL